MQHGRVHGKTLSRWAERTSVWWWPRFGHPGCVRSSTLKKREATSTWLVVQHQGAASWTQHSQAAVPSMELLLIFVRTQMAWSRPKQASCWTEIPHSGFFVLGTYKACLLIRNGLGLNQRESARETLGFFQKRSRTEKGWKGQRLKNQNSGFSDQSPHTQNNSIEQKKCSLLLFFLRSLLFFPFFSVISRLPISLNTRVVNEQCLSILFSFSLFSLFFSFLILINSFLYFIFLGEKFFKIYYLEVKFRFSNCDSNWKCDTGTKCVRYSACLCLRLWSI